MSEQINRQLALRWFEYAKNDLQAAALKTILVVRCIIRKFN
ncbi:MAG: hypothetical protein ACOYED_08275 [Peptococcia bacterium]|jgi:hypothetical protein